MGFKEEGLLRWDRVFPGDQGKVGNGEDIREDDPRPDTLVDTLSCSPFAGMIGRTVGGNE